MKCHMWYWIEERQKKGKNKKCSTLINYNSSFWDLISVVVISNISRTLPPPHPTPPPPPSHPTPSCSEIHFIQFRVLLMKNSAASWSSSDFVWNFQFTVSSIAHSYIKKQWVLRARMIKWNRNVFSYKKTCRMKFPFDLGIKCLRRECNVMLNKI